MISIVSWILYQIIKVCEKGKPPPRGRIKVRRSKRYLKKVIEVYNIIVHIKFKLYIRSIIKYRHLPIFLCVVLLLYINFLLTYKRKF